ncbi:hypothetical protein OTU49_000448 [Cherax quadricarinatus]|uniref:Uncharacterized protein n=1 Tax=Cherax quadricarinatus TaxID=27406 RepID=A0AAW0XKL1_CHEQU
MCGGVVLIVTRWWLAWLLWSVACVMALLGANLSPSWLLAPPSTDPATPQHLGLVTQPVQNYTSFTPSFLQDQSSGGPAEWSAWRSVRERPRASLGLWLRCTVMGSEPRTSLHCGVYVTAVPDLPSAQVVALVGVVSATVVTAVSCLAICSSACLRLISGRNWFTIIGTMQATAVFIDRRNVPGRSGCLSNGLGLPEGAEPVWCRRRCLLPQQLYRRLGYLPHPGCQHRPPPLHLPLLLRRQVNHYRRRSRGNQQRQQRCLSHITDKNSPLAGSWRFNLCILIPQEERLLSNLGNGEVFIRLLSSFFFLAFGLCFRTVK